jgi:hypothetical protein
VNCLTKVLNVRHEQVSIPLVQGDALKPRHSPRVSEALKPHQPEECNYYILVWFSILLVYIPYYSILPYSNA